ncbi:MAG: serine/threonine protein kinase [Candidatus Obscuribacterales bacterium]|nr:serine/threonine protein kinase [Candidatus Obscuribacterales bacterium]
MELVEDDILDERWRIRRRLGEGGFGTVYEATDEQLGRTVAIKVLRDSLLTDVPIRRRFLREGKILATVQSPNLVRLFSVNLSSSGMLYLVMELLSGRTVRATLIDRGRIPEEEALRIARDIAEALTTLESFGVVHRDLKPDNVMLDRTASGEIRTKVLDFGLSALRSKDIKDSYATTEGTMIGSVYYMAPENCMGQKADVRGDFYSLGCLLYESLTGQPPFYANDPVAVVFKQVNDPMPESPLKTCGVSAGTRQLLLQLLQKEPALRYQSGAELLDAIDSCMSGTAPQGLSSVSSRPPQRNPFLRFLLPAAALVISAGICAGITIHISRQSRPSFLVDDTKNSSIVSWCDKILTEKKDDATLIQLNDQLRSMPPSSARAKLASKFDSYYPRFEYPVKSLVAALNTKTGAMTDREWDSVLRALQRLRKLRLSVLQQGLSMAILRCSFKGSGPDDPGISWNTRRREAAAILAESGSLWDTNEAVKQAGSLVFEGGDDSDLKVSLILVSVALRVDQSERDFLLRYVAPTLESAPVAVLQANDQLLSAVFENVRNAKNQQVMDQLSGPMFRVKRATCSDVQLADWCFSRGNEIQGFNIRAAGAWWNRAVELYERSNNADSRYIGSLLNRSGYLLHEQRLDQAKATLMKAWKAMHSTAQYPFSFKFHWCLLANRLTDRESQSRFAQLADDVNDPWWNSTDANERIALGRMRCDFYNGDKQNAKLEIVARRTLQIPGDKNTPDSEISMLQSYLFRSVLDVRPFDPRKVQKILRELTLDARSSKDVISEFYRQASVAAIESESLGRDGTFFRYFLQRQFELLGVSRDVANKYARASFLASYGDYNEAEPIFKSIIRSPGSKDWSDNVFRVVVHNLITCDLYTGRIEEAIETLELGLKRTPTTYTFILGVDCYLRSGCSARSAAMAEQAALSREISQEQAALIAKTVRLIQERPAEASLPLAELMKAGGDPSSQLYLTVRLLLAWQLAEADRMNEANRYLKIAAEIARENQHDGWARKLILARHCALGGRFEYALILHNEMLQTREFASLAPVEKRKFYTDMAICQSALHKDAEAALSISLAHSCFAVQL